MSSVLLNIKGYAAYKKQAFCQQCGGEAKNLCHYFNPLMVKPFRLTYLSKRGEGGGGVVTPSLNFNPCLSDLLLIGNL